MVTKKSPAKKSSKTTLRETKKKAPQTVDAKKSRPSASDSVDAQLAKYRSMRDFHVTAEPAGGAGKTKPRPTGALPFVIQKHAASHLHYDFRLGWAGVLKSWAVAKGPSYFTGDRRLAVQVEDHPMEYGGFEGIIPKGQYGGGTVMVWDQGTWTPQPGYENVDAGLREGSLKFEMNGKKMKGKWTLVRMGGRAANESKPNWLLIKEHDEFELSEGAPAITEEKPNSVVTGRSLEEIAAQEDHVWNSKETARGEAWYRQDAKSPAKKEKPSPGPKAKPSGSVDGFIKDLPKQKQAEFVPPQLAMEATAPPTSDGWLHELKLDGYRIQARKTSGKVALLTRKGLDWTHRMRGIAEAVAALPAENLTIDGEVAVVSENGTTSFADLQAAFQEDGKHELTYFCFDLLHVDGHDPKQLPLRQRKEILAKVLAGQDGAVRLSEHLETDGEQMFRKACELHAEGIISKRADAAYRPGRSGDWLKSKCLREQEFVIGGYTLSSDGGDRIGSLLLGYYDGDELVYAGRTGTGFTQKMRKTLMTTLHALKTKSAAFAHVPAEARRGAVWVKPKLVAQVRFATWTSDYLVRQAAFLGLREDKAAKDVAREEATVAPQPKQARGTQGTTPSVAAKTMKKSPVAAQAQGVRVTHPSKVLDAASGLTKQELVDFYWAVAKRMLPHIAGRPLSLVRCPEGSDKPCFYQKHVTHMLPPGVGGINVPNKKTGAPEEYITLDSREALSGLGQMGVLEVHPWGSHNEDLEHPDRLIFDLDPDDSIEWKVLAGSALEVRKRLRAAGLTSFLKTTGGKGLHIVAPIASEHSWTEVKELAHRFVLQMERTDPALYLTKMSKAARKGKIYLDYLRNERGATAVAPYSPRARAGAPVSLPLAWNELEAARQPRFAVKSFHEWKTRLSKDPWKEMLTVRQSVRLDAFDKR